MGQTTAHQNKQANKILASTKWKFVRAEVSVLSEVLHPHPHCAVRSILSLNLLFSLMSFTVMRIFKGRLWGFEYVLWIRFICGQWLSWSMSLVESSRGMTLRALPVIRGYSWDVQLQITVCHSSEGGELFQISIGRQLVGEMLVSCSSAPLVSYPEVKLTSGFLSRKMQKSYWWSRGMHAE